MTIVKLIKSYQGCVIDSASDTDCDNDGYAPQPLNAVTFALCRGHRGS